MALRTSVRIAGRRENIQRCRDAKLVADVGVNGVLAEKVKVVETGTGVGPTRRIANRVPIWSEKFSLSCFSIDHENVTLLPLTDFTHPGWMITSLLGVASSVISVSKKLRKSPCARADGANSNIAPIAAAIHPPCASHHLPIQDPPSLAQVKRSSDDK